MGIVILLAAVYAQATAAFLSAWIVFREFRPAIAAGSLSIGGLVAVIAVFFGLTEPKADVPAETAIWIALAFGVVAGAALIRSLVKPRRGRPTIGESLTIAVIGVAALAGTYAAGAAMMRS